MKYLNLFVGNPVYLGVFSNPLWRFLNCIICDDCRACNPLELSLASTIWTGLRACSCMTEIITLSSHVSICNSSSWLILSRMHVYRHNSIQLNSTGQFLDICWTLVQHMSTKLNSAQLSWPVVCAIKLWGLSHAGNDDETKTVFEKLHVIVLGWGWLVLSSIRRDFLIVVCHYSCII
jgi:hypothetical protein